MLIQYFARYMTSLLNWSSVAVHKSFVVFLVCVIGSFSIHFLPLLKLIVQCFLYKMEMSISDHNGGMPN